jgi:hypothetical protein
VDKVALARAVGFPAQAGQSQFAITRGNAFEAQLMADDCAILRQLLGDALGFDLAASVLFDHPILRLTLAGQDVFLEPDLIAFEHDGRYHIVEIKSFAVVDGQADANKVAAAAIQAAVYVLALRQRLGDRDAVSHDIVLVCPENFANRPVAVRVDVRRQLIVLEHQIARLTRVERILDGLPAGLTLDLAPDEATGEPTRPRAELTDALGHVAARFSPGCIDTCELAFYCRDEASAGTARLGAGVREDLGGVATIAEALGLADGSLAPADDQREIAAMLRTAARVYGESLA